MPRAQLKAALRELERRPDAGKPLTRALTGCRSIRIGGSENRLVYQVLGEGEDDAVVEVIAIGRRREEEVYDTAARRL